MKSLRTMRNVPSLVCRHRIRRSQRRKVITPASHHRSDGRTTGRYNGSVSDVPTGALDSPPHVERPDRRHVLRRRRSLYLLTSLTLLLLVALAAVDAAPPSRRHDSRG